MQELVKVKKILIMSYKSFVYDIVEDFKPVEDIKSQCVVHFRPGKGYNGGYGFDWFRVGDSEIEGDFHFKDIIGRYYNVSTKATVERNYNQKNKDGKEETVTVAFERNSKLDQPKMYVRKKNSFYKFGIPWKKNVFDKETANYTYYAPRMTLMEGDNAVLSLITEINPKKGKPQKIELKFEKDDAKSYLSIDKETIPSQDGNTTLKITCNKEFDKTQVLNVLADGMVCGRLKIAPNAKKYQRNIKVLFVNVKTNISKEQKQTGTPAPGSKELFLRTLKQAFVTVPEGVQEVTLDCTGWFKHSFKFRWKFCKKVKEKYVIDVDKAVKMRTYMTDLLKDQYGDKYDGYYQVFFFGEGGHSAKSGGLLNGYAILDSFYGVYFSGHKAATVGHEMFHALGLKHTFDYTDTSRSDFAYKIAKTDNMLDYSHIVGIERKSLFYWQWRKLNSNFPNVK